MSNVSSVNPYAATATAAAVAASATAVAAAARWLAEETAAERSIRARVRDDMRQDRLKGMRERAKEQLPVITATLHLRDRDSLVRAAESLGYAVDRLGAGSEPTRLRSASGERLAIAADTSGRLVLGTQGGAGRIQAVVRQHTVQQAVAHLTARGMSVRAATLANGEVQLLAREERPGVGGAAEVRAHVHDDGRTTVDVDRLQGTRCQQIVQELATATGGVVEQTAFKPAAYQLPGEPAKTSVRAQS